MDEALREAGLLGGGEGARFVRTGHFAYESGHHGDTWLALELLFADTGRLRRAAAQLADRLRGLDAELVVGPLIGGALVGQWVADALGAGFAYAEPRSGAARSGYAVPEALRGALSGRRVLVVDDAINAGTAALACARDVDSAGGRVAALACLIARATAAAAIRERSGLAVEALATVPWSIWSARDCPLCRAGAPLDGPARADASPPRAGTPGAAPRDVPAGAEARRTRDGDVAGLSYLSPKAQVRPSPIQGRGLFAAAAIAKDEVVAVKGGYVFDRRTLERLELSPAEVQIGEGLFIGPLSAAEREGGMIFSNHSCRPNLGVKGQIVFVAMRDVSPGEELTHDWAMTDDDDYEMTCSCGATGCRGTITGRDWRRPELQDRYRGYMSWYLADKIAQGDRRR